MRKKNLLLIIISVLIIIIACATYLLIKIKTREQEETTIQAYTGEPFYLVTDRNNFFMVQNSVKTFYKYYALMYENTQKENLKKTYSLLDEKYIDFKNITQENIKNILPEIKEVEPIINNMYVSNQSTNISIYLVEGVLREEESKKIKNFSLMVQIDNKNKTFSILLQDYIQQKHPNFNINTNFKLELLNNISRNSYNLYVLEDITDQTYSIYLFNRYKDELLYNTQTAYEILDEEYKNKKFETLDNLKKYVASNKTEISNMKVSQYGVTKTNTYTQYLCINNYGQYYIFRETGLAKYTVILDTYTVDMPEFLEKYKSANTSQRVGYNIQRCIDAINAKDYAYVYNKLDEEFKNLNYPTLESFSKAVKNNLFNNNKVNSGYTTNEGEIYIYKLSIVDSENDTKKRDVTFIMQLNEGTDFVMSLTFNG